MRTRRLSKVKDLVGTNLIVHQPNGRKREQNRVKECLYYFSQKYGTTTEQAVENKKKFLDSF